MSSHDSENDAPAFNSTNDSSFELNDTNDANMMDDVISLLGYVSSDSETDSSKSSPVSWNSQLSTTDTSVVSQHGTQWCDISNNDSSTFDWSSSLECDDVISLLGHVSSDGISV